MKNIIKPYYVALDLEMNQPSGRIIQVGAVVGDMQTGSCVTRFECLVNPGESLEPRIAQLCGIHADALARAGTIAQAYDLLSAWLLPYAQTRQLNALTWGGGDTSTLRSELGLDDERWLFGRRWIDVKTVFIAWQNARGLTGVGGLARSMGRMGLAFQGRKHYATDDAWNTFRMYFKLLHEFSNPSRMPPYLLDASIVTDAGVDLDRVDGGRTV